LPDRHQAHFNHRPDSHQKVEVGYLGRLVILPDIGQGLDLEVAVPNTSQGHHLQGQNQRKRKGLGHPKQKGMMQKSIPRKRSINDQCKYII